MSCRGSNGDFELRHVFNRSGSASGMALVSASLNGHRTMSDSINAGIFKLSDTTFRHDVFVKRFNFPRDGSTTRNRVNTGLSGVTLANDRSSSFSTVCDHLRGTGLRLSSGDNGDNVCIGGAIALGSLGSQLGATLRGREGVRVKLGGTSRVLGRVRVLGTGRLALGTRLRGRRSFGGTSGLHRLLSLGSRLSSVAGRLALSGNARVGSVFLAGVGFYLSGIGGVGRGVSTGRGRGGVVGRGLSFVVGPSNGTAPRETRRVGTGVSALGGRRRRLGHRYTRLRGGSALGPSPTFLVLLVLNILLVTDNTILYLCCLFLNLTAVTINTLTFLMSGVFGTGGDDGGGRGEVVRVEFGLGRLLSTVNARASGLGTVGAGLGSGSRELGGRRNVFRGGLLRVRGLSGRGTVRSTRLRKLLNDAFSNVASTRHARRVSSLAGGTTARGRVGRGVGCVLGSINGVSCRTTTRGVGRTRNFGLSKSFSRVGTSCSGAMGLQVRHDGLCTALATRVGTVGGVTGGPSIVGTRVTTLHLGYRTRGRCVSLLSLTVAILSGDFSRIEQGCNSILSGGTATVFGRVASKGCGGLGTSGSFSVSIRRDRDFNDCRINCLSGNAISRTCLSLQLTLGRLVHSAGNDLPTVLSSSLARFSSREAGTTLGFLGGCSRGGRVVVFAYRGSMDSATRTLNTNVLGLRWVAIFCVFLLACGGGNDVLEGWWVTCCGEECVFVLGSRCLGGICTSMRTEGPNRGRFRRAICRILSSVRPIMRSGPRCRG